MKYTSIFSGDDVVVTINSQPISSAIEVQYEENLIPSGEMSKGVLRYYICSDFNPKDIFQPVHNTLHVLCKNKSEKHMVMEFKDFHPSVAKSSIVVGRDILIEEIHFLFSTVVYSERPFHFNQDTGLYVLDEDEEFLWRPEVSI